MRLTDCSVLAAPADKPPSRTIAFTETLMPSFIAYSGTLIEKLQFTIELSGAIPMNFEMVRGDDLRVIVDVVDSDGNPIDLVSSQSIKWGVSRSFGWPPILEKTTSDGSVFIVGSQLQFDITANDSASLPSGKLNQEIELTNATGKVRTFARGTITIKQQIIGE